VSIELRHGRWQETLDGETADALIFDGPFGKETHDGYGNDGRAARSRGDKPRDPRYRHRPGYTDQISYEFLDEADVEAFVASWSERTLGWVASITDHNLAPVWSDHLSDAGRLVFPPIPIVDVGSRCRLSGDGPSSWSWWLVVARPRTAQFQRWGTLSGAYIRSPNDPRSPRTGGKPLGIMREIVRDYAIPKDSSRVPGWPPRPRVVDPYAGSATTLMAARELGLDGLGSEADRATFEDALDRISATPTRANSTGTLPLF